MDRLYLKGSQSVSVLRDTIHQVVEDTKAGPQAKQIWKLIANACSVAELRQLTPILGLVK